MNIANRQESSSLPAAMAVLLLLSVIWTSLSCATELFIPGIEGQPGDPIEVSVNIDKVDNLAGVKLVIKYDPEILLYKDSKKTEYTASLMHIVNDKKPGLLIAVMAGAKGISGQNLQILSLSFEIRESVQTALSTLLEIAEVQLMSDQLKDIKCKVTVNPITISTGKKR